MKQTASFARVRHGALMPMLLFGVLCLCAGSAAAQAKDDPVDHTSWMPAEYSSLVHELEQVSDSPLVLAPLLDLHRLASWMTKDQALASIAAQRSRVHNALGRAWIDYSELRLMLALADREKVQKISKGLGFADVWALVGPFRNDGMAGFRTAYEPETDGFSPQGQSFHGKFADLQWLPVEHRTETGYVAAHETIADSENATLYAISECYFNAAPSNVLLAVDGAYKLWVNESPVAKRETNLGGVFLRDRAPVQAKKGWNRIFLKVATEGEKPGWHMRFVDKKDRSVVRECRIPLQDVKGVVDSDAFEDAVSLDDAFTTLREKEGWDADALIRAAYILKTFQHQDASEPWKRFLAGNVQGGGDATQVLRRAKVEQAHWRTMQELQRLDLEKAPTDAVLYTAQLLALEPGENAAAQRRKYLESLVQRNADDPRVQLTMMAVIGDFVGGFRPPADWLKLLQQYGARPALCERVLRVTGGNKTDEREWVQRCADRGLESIADVKAYLITLAQRGDEQTVQEQISRLAPLWSGRGDWARIEQMVAGFHEDWGKMLASMDEEIVQRPHDAGNHQRRADLLMRLGRYDEAAADLNATIELRPQATQARKLLPYLEEQQEDFYTAWRVDNDELRELAKTIDLSDVTTGNVVAQRVVNVYPSGLSANYEQSAYVAKTREGAESISTTGWYYDPNEDLIQILSVRVLSPDGSVRETYQSTDYKPYEGTGGMYLGTRVKYLTIPGVKAGDIVSVETLKSEIATHNMFDDYFGDVWYLDSFSPTALNRYVLYHPETRPVYGELGDKPIDMESTPQDGRVRYVREERDIPAIKRESMMKGMSERSRYLHLSTYRDVDQMANWYWNLIKDQFTTSSDLVATVHELTKDITNRREQVRAIYNYVVRNIRYVALEFGVDGYRPHRTTQCYEAKYGDCKDTASLMKAMLQIAGIPSHVVLIRTSDLGKFQSQLPSLMIYNHAILYVPELDMYLDGTATSYGMEELVGGDQGATALIIKDGQGGVPVTTPFLSAEQNVEETWIDVDGADSQSTGRVRVKYIGNDGPSLRAWLEGAEDKRQRLEQWFASYIPKLRVETVDIQGLEDNETPVEIVLQTQGGQWLVARGNEYVMSPFGHEVYALTRYAASSTRTTAVYLGPPSIDRIHFKIRLPDNLVPADTETRTIEYNEPDFARFSMTTRWDEATHSLQVEGHLRWSATEISVEQYGAFRAFTRRVENAANKALILKEVKP